MSNIISSLECIYSRTNIWLRIIGSPCFLSVSQLWAFMFVVHTSNFHSQNCTRRTIIRLGIDALIANILVNVVVFCSKHGFIAQEIWRLVRTNEGSNERHVEYSCQVSHRRLFLAAVFSRRYQSVRSPHLQWTQARQWPPWGFTFVSMKYFCSIEVTS